MVNRIPRLTLWRRPRAIDGKRRARAVLLVLLVLSCAGSGVAAAAQPWQPWLSPTAMARLDARMLPVEVSSFCSENCRYDRQGRGQEPPAGNPRPDRYLYLDGHGDAVLYDDPGSGVITRLWLTSGGPYPACLDASLRLKLYFGNATTPAIVLPLASLFDGSTAPFQAPLTFNPSTGSGAYASYVPIRYANGIRLAVSGLGQGGPCSNNVPPLLWYQIDAQRLPPGMVTTNFSLADRFPQLIQFLVAQGSDPWSRSLSPQAMSRTLAVGADWSLLSATGTGWLAGLRIKGPAMAWEDLRLEIDIDGRTAANLPLTQLTGVDAADPVPPRSPLMGVDANGWLYLWWPMPWRQQVQVSLKNTGSTSHAVQVALYRDTAEVPADAGYWFAHRHDQCGQGADHQQTLLALDGSGKLMGLRGRFAAANGPDNRYLESDVRLRMDGAISSQWQGSGLEDFYNGGFYFDWGRAYRQPWSGASVVDTSGESAMWRLLLADAPVFGNGIAVLQEAGASPAESLDVCMDSVAVGYHDTERFLVPVATLDVADPGDRARYRYILGAQEQCAPLAAQFADAAATSRTAGVCRRSSGEAHFRFHLYQPASVFRLRRIVDAASAGQAARIEVNNQLAGWFPPVRPDSVRRWQMQEAALRVPPGVTGLHVSIQPLWGAHGDAGTFTASRYQLWATPADGIFKSGFEES